MFSFSFPGFLPLCISLPLSVRSILDVPCYSFSLGFTCSSPAVLSLLLLCAALLLFVILRFLFPAVTFLVLIMGLRFPSCFHIFVMLLPPIAAFAFLSSFLVSSWSTFCLCACPPFRWVFRLFSFWFSSYSSCGSLGFCSPGGCFSRASSSAVAASHLGLVL